VKIGEGEFKTIPDYVKPENRRKILELAVANEKEVSEVECCEYLIRHWNETVEDGNPLYNDRAYARSRGFKDIVAQPGMIICTLVLPYRWPTPAGFVKTRQLLHFELKELLELPVGILANYEAFFHAPIEIGDRLSTTGRGSAEATSASSRRATSTSGTSWSARPTRISSRTEAERARAERPIQRRRPGPRPDARSRAPWRTRHRTNLRRAIGSGAAGTTRRRRCSSPGARGGLRRRPWIAIGRM
jgi:hypothetical protein